MSDSLFRCLCTGSRYRVLYNAEHATVVECLSCGQVSVLGVDMGAAKAAYDSSQYFIDRNPYIARWNELAEHFQSILDVIANFKKDGLLLDVGCSVGILLEVAARNGFAVKGIEVSAWASQYARDKGFDVVTGGLTDASFSSRHFDIVILNHVLEHVSDPVGILKEANRILKDDGLLVVGVPNFGSWMARIKKRKWASLQPDQHIWQFTRSSLSKLLRRCSFREIHFEAKENHKIEWFRPDSVLVFFVNTISRLTNNAEAMLVLSGKNPEEQIR